MKKWNMLILIIWLFVIDQLLKSWAIKTLVPVSQIVVIPNLFNLTYVENRGAAFGIFQGRTLILSVVSGILLLAIIIALMQGRLKSHFPEWCVSVGVAGGLGNLYDRITRGFVVDYIDFSALFGFPVFNFADCLVVCATLFILFYCLRIESKDAKEADLGKTEEKSGHG